MGYAFGVDEVAGAIADPVRREILAMLRERSMSAGQVADRFAISRPAVSRHLRVLRESGLVHDELTGRQRFYRLDPAPLAQLARWLAPFLPSGLAGLPEHPATGHPADPDTGQAAAWTGRFDALATEVYRTRRERRRPAASGEPAAAIEREERSA
jgi:DNA-binding transcriptional ArsR family regulator